MTATKRPLDQKARRSAIALFALDRQATRPEFDVHAFGLMAVAIELVAQYGHGDGKCANDKIKHVRASHGRISLDTIAFALTA
jgi:hypothetical protein